MEEIHGESSAKRSAVHLVGPTPHVKKLGNASVLESTSACTYTPCSVEDAQQQHLGMHTTRTGQCGGEAFRFTYP